MQNYNSKLKIDIKIRAYKFSLAIIQFINNLVHAQTNKIISGQLLRAATSIGANIIEAQAASSKREFKNFMNIALKSANETKYWLCLARDSNLTQEKASLEKLLQEAVELSKILASIQISLKKK